MPVLENTRWELFCQNYVKGMSAHESYVKAGYRDNRQAASRLLSHVDIKARIKELNEAAAEVAVIDVAKVMEEMSVVAFANMGDYVTIDPENGRVSIDFSKLSAKDLRAVTKIKQRHINTKDGPEIVETQFELASKTTGLDQLAKCLDMYANKSEVTVNVLGDKADQLAAARERAQNAVVNGSNKN